MKHWPILLLLTGCTRDEGDTSIDDTGSPPGRSDEELIRDLIAGSETDVASVLHEIAWSDGLPVHTADDTWLFVVADDRSGWSLAGDHDGWAGAPMTEAAGFSWLEVAIPEPAGSLYKLERGGDWLADPLARSYTHDVYGEISYVRPPTDTSRLDRWPGLEGHGLGPRDVRIHVPPGTGPWPVLYMHDGQNLFDPEAFFGGWQVQANLEELGEDVLVVGIDNTIDRMDEYSHTTDDIGTGSAIGGRGDDYAALIHEDLRPHVEAVYGSTGLDGVMGSSMGGLISLYVAHLHPDAYDFAGSLSGTLGWGRFALSNPVMEELYLGEGHRDFVIYVDSGGGDGGDGCIDADGDGFPEDDANDADNFCVTRHFADAMADAGYTWQADLFHWHEEGAAHNEYAWAQRLQIPLGIFTSLD